MGFEEEDLRVKRHSKHIVSREHAISVTNH